MEYYSKVIFSNGDVVCHYGKKGMKWGRHSSKIDYKIKIKDDDDPYPVPQTGNKNKELFRGTGKPMDAFMRLLFRSGVIDHYVGPGMGDMGEKLYKRVRNSRRNRSRVRVRSSRT